MDKHHLVKSQLEEIDKANNDDLFAQQLHERCISELVKHINTTVPFYQRMGCKSFGELPVVNKLMMKDHLSDFKSVSPLVIGKNRHTSGSTGIPFVIIQDLKKAKRINAELVYFREITGDELGTKFINLVSPSRMESNNRLNNFKQNVIYIDVTKMDVHMMENLYRLLLSSHSIYYMMGYASALERIANHFEEKGYQGNYSLKAIVSSSEILTNKTAQKLEKVFNCKVYDRYSNEDNGFIAQTIADGTHDFYVNRASYYVEVLKLDSDAPAAANEVGRIVITDYFNYAQPFVRYDTGDLGAYSYRILNGAKRFVLTQLAGRISDVVYDVDDNPISTFAIGCALEIFNNIKQYQLIQKTNSEFILNITDPLRQYNDLDYITVLKQTLGEGINVKVNYTDSIPVLNSGKFRRVICNYHPKKI